MHCLMMIMIVRTTGKESNFGVGPPLPTSSGGVTSRGHGYQPPMPSVDLSELPTEAPFKAFVGNLMPMIQPADIGEFFQSQVQVIIAKHRTLLRPSQNAGDWSAG